MPSVPLSEVRDMNRAMSCALRAGDVRVQLHDASLPVASGRYMVTLEVQGRRVARPLVVLR
jgi:hypothetical protein